MSSDHNNENAPGLAARTEPELHAYELSYRRRFEAAQDGTRKMRELLDAPP